MKKPSNSRAAAKTEFLFASWGVAVLNHTANRWVRTFSSPLFLLDSTSTTMKPSEFGKKVYRTAHLTSNNCHSFPKTCIVWKKKQYVMMCTNPAVSARALQPPGVWGSKPQGPSSTCHTTMEVLIWVDSLVCQSTQSVFHRHERTHAKSGQQTMTMVS